MAEKWDKQLMDLLKRTGDEFKRTSEYLKEEAQRLMVEVKDPAKQAKVKEGLDNLRSWAVTTGKQAAEHIESAVRRVEETVEQAFDNKAPSAPQESAAAPTPPSPESSEPQPRAEKKAAAKKSAPKSIGRKKTAATKAPAKKAAAKKSAPKSIGRKKPARPAP